MKFNIFTYEGFKDTNIGDYIQSLAARQFLDKENIAYIDDSAVSVPRVAV